MLALALGGRTVAEWQRAMTPGEFEAWAAFYELWPFDDLHRHHRPAALVAGSMAGKVGDHLSWLQPAAGFGAAGAAGDGVPLDDDAAEAAGEGAAGGLEAARGWSGDAAGPPASPPPSAPRRTPADIATLRAFGLWKNGKVVKR